MFTLRMASVGSAALLALVVASGCTDSAGTSNTFTAERTSVHGLPHVVLTETAAADVKVESIDYDNRAIALAGSDGKTQIFTVGREVRNFTQIKKGDTVRAQYLQKITASVSRSDEPHSAMLAGQIDLAPLGAKPGIVATRTAEISGTVSAIDHKARSVTIRTLGGDVALDHVDPKVKSFEKVQKGDRVVINYTEAVSITVISP
ncbi:MAG: hypothetical protein K8S99_04085 [Planctomycetes bacterium]|nr:hypothetical protein [Planctomycetota bacterium]